MNGKIHFANNEAACLFATEITGQLSDGRWENTRPYDHWKFWCNAEVIVDGLKSNYNLRCLTRYIKEEMKDCIRFARSRFYRPELMHYKRTLTEGRYPASGLPFPFDKPRELDAAADPAEKFPYTLKATLEAVSTAIYGTTQPDPAFMETVKTEWSRVQLQKDLDHYDNLKEERERVKKLMAEVGITADNLAAVREEIKKIEVTDQDLNSVIYDVWEAMNTRKN